MITPFISGGPSMAGEQPTWLLLGYLAAPAPSLPPPSPPGNPPLTHPGTPLLLLLHAPRPPSLPSAPPPTHPLPQATGGRTS